MANLGEKGFHADWVSYVCPTHLPLSIFDMLEGFMGNRIAHEWLLLFIANDETMARAIAADVPLPGMHISCAPSFHETKRRIKQYEKMLTMLKKAEPHLDVAVPNWNGCGRGDSNTGNVSNCRFCTTGVVNNNNSVS